MKRIFRPYVNFERHFYFMEIWREIDGYNGVYKVSSYGNVKSFASKSPRMLKPDTARGYKRVILSINGKQKRHIIHRLVAMAFIPNPENKPQVNHKDEVRHNNNVSNLEWVTQRENITYTLTKNGITKIKGVNWIERMKSYQCSIYLNGKKNYLGSTRDLEKAKK